MQMQDRITTSEAAELLGLSNAHAARRQLSRWGVAPVARRAGRGGESEYDRSVVLAAMHGRAGRGARTDLKGKTMLLHQRRDCPWTDPYDHQLSARKARWIADDIIANGRWGVGDQPVYDVSGDDTPAYVGDLSFDSVRSRVGGDIISVFTPKLPRRDELVESVYRQILPAAARWDSLVSHLTEAVATGRLAADEKIEDAATRLLRNGYDVTRLQQELSA